MAEKFPVTRAIHFLRSQGVSYEPAMYRYEGRGDVARTAAAAVGASEEETYKTLVFRCGEEPVLVLMDAAGTVSLSKLAGAAGSKVKAAPCAVKDAERYTGYQVGGISPFGVRREMRVFADEGILLQERVWLNGGSHGFMVKVGVEDAVRVLGAVVGDLRQ